MMQTTPEREVPAEVRPQVHKLAVTNRWLVAAVVVLLLAGLGACGDDDDAATTTATTATTAAPPTTAAAIVQATADEGENILISGRDELSARQEQMVDVAERWLEAADAADIGALTALMTPDATMSGSTPWAKTVRVDDGSFAAFVETYFTDAALTSQFATLVIGNIVITDSHYSGYGEELDVQDLYKFTGSGDPLISSIVVVGSRALQ